MSEKTFDYNVRDSQGTDVGSVAAEKFDVEAYREYEEDLLKANRQFWNSRSGVAVYRRFRVPEVFSYGCSDMKHSLELQLGALQESMKYKMDIANFLEPWYGIGTIASAYGLEYIWNDNQAPATIAPFKSLDEALEYKYRAVEDTAIGRHTLNMIEYFLDKTKGKIPMSLTDTQSPLNIAAHLFDVTTLFLEMYDNPSGYKLLLDTISNLLIDFTKKQAAMIGGAVASPGHGFASSRCFDGIGMSDDNMLMLSDDMYEELEIPFREKVGAEFGGVAFHSCGNWSRKIEVVKKIKNLVIADGAFSPQTDPDPNTLQPFSYGFANTGVILNARIVGDVDEITNTVKKIWKSGMKLVVVTYCETPEEQEKAYNNIHEICGC
jgi:hypothetical protein